MSRLVFHPPAVQPSGAQVRIDTASGSDTPATGLLSMDGSPIPATLAADGVTGAVPAFQGPADGTTTLYLKTLDEAHAAVVATVAVTGTSAGTPAAPTGTSSASGDVISDALPAGVEFAFWGYSSTSPSSLIAAFRVTTAGDYSTWGTEGDTALAAGFDLVGTPGDADLAAMNVGEYVILRISLNTEAGWLTTVASIGWNPQAVLPGAFHPPVRDPGLTSLISDVADLTTRVEALENP